MFLNSKVAGKGHEAAQDSRALDHNFLHEEYNSNKFEYPREVTL